MVETTDKTHDHNVKLRPYSKLMHWYRWNDVYIPGFNETARAALQLKYQRDKYKIEQYWNANTVEAKRWFRETPMFFGFSSPRSGTVFLSDLLIQEVAGGQIEHEANIVDYPNFAKAVQDEQNAYDYVARFKMKDIFYRNRVQQPTVYGEVNPFLRMHCKAISKMMPEAKLFHVIRDGREIVRSVMSRDKLGKKDPIAKMICPPKSDPYFMQWGVMTRFEKVCWQWQFTNRYMRENIPQLVYFHKLRKDYPYFKSRVLDFLGLEVSEEAWTDYVNTPKNVSKIYRFPHWKEWSEEDMETFNRICGAEMAKYDFDC